MLEWMRSRRRALGLVIRLLPACVVCVWWPPLVAFEPRRILALALVAAGAALAAAPKRRLLPRWLGIAGYALVWGTVGWCILSQVAPLDQPLSLVWPARLLPILAAAGLWLWLRFPRSWQRRTTAALILPTLLGLGVVAVTSPPHPANFPAYYLAADSRGTLYVTDAHSPVIRVFGPDGALKAKLRPGLASRLGPPGPGFNQPGPFNDPERLGIFGTPAPANGAVASGPERDRYGDAFSFCGLALDAHDRLYVPDLLRGKMLRFLPDGHLETSWPLPRALRPSRNCVAVTGDSVYVSGQFGDIRRYDAAGHLLWSAQLPSTIAAGLGAAPTGGAVYVMAIDRLYVVDPRADTVSPQSLPGGQRIYGAVLGMPQDRLLVADLSRAVVDVYCDGTRLCGRVAIRGSLPGQLAYPTGLARDVNGNIYVADATYHVVQRFNAAGHVNAVYWSPDDDEVE